MAFSLTFFRTNRTQVLGIFLATYAFIFILSLFTPVRGWNFQHVFQADYTAILLPIPAFFLTFYLVDWVTHSFETRMMDHILFLPGLWVAGLAAYFIQLRWYYNNLEQLTLDRGIEIMYDLSLAYPCTTGGLTLCFWEFFITSHFILFLLGMTGGWFAWHYIHPTQD